MASGHSLDPLFDKSFQCIVVISNTPKDNAIDANAYFTKVGKWLDRALSDTQFVDSKEGRQEAADLYDEGKNLANSDGGLSAHLHDVFSELDGFIAALKEDRSTMNLINSIHTLGVDISSFTQTTASETASAAVHWKRQLVVWLIPRILRAMKSAPMPRVEMTSLEIDAAIDAMLLTVSAGAASLLPDSIVVQEWTEIRVAPGFGLADDADVQSTTRMRIHVDGLRVAAYGVGYFAHYKMGGRSWLGYEDEGLLDVVIGQPGTDGDGLKMDIELETSFGNGANDTGLEPIFKVLDVQVDVPGLSLAIHQSRHWLLNTLFITPFAGPVGRLAARYVLRQQVQSALEMLEKALRGLKKGAEDKAREDGQRGDVEFKHWWSTFLNQFGTFGSSIDGEGDQDEDEPEQDVYTETHTSATMTGIVRTTVTQVEPEPGQEVPDPTETSLAIGIGAQLLPGKAQPELDDIPSVTGIANIALQEVDEAVEDAKDVVKDGVSEAVGFRRNLEAAGERMEVREVVEKKRNGWKSRAFDFGR